MIELSMREQECESQAREMELDPAKRSPEAGMLN
jgi:hypothetical protein